jgi:CSLREA domain-containing protein
MKISVVNLFVLTFLLLSVLAVTSVSAQNTTTLFTVNHNGDSNDATIGDNICADSNGKCTLRAAIQEANSNPFQDGVNFALPTSSTIELALGELLITSNIYIAGPGARFLTVQRSQAPGTPDFRIFRIQYEETPLIPVTIRGLTIKNGKSIGDGGAVYIHHSTVVQLSDVAIINNQAGGSGGGIFSSGTLYLTRSLVASNTGAGLFSGGIININHFGTSIISNSTLTNNTGNQGGALYNNGNLLLISNTISHNIAATSGSSVMNDSLGNLNVLNTIIGMDTASSVSSLSGAFNSLGNNLITDARNSTGFTNGVNGDQVSNNNAINPLLGDLADNSGQTDTRALLSGSPAINSGNDCVYYGNCSQPVPPGFSLTTDQRMGNLRRGGAAVDVGAFEYQANGFMSSIGLGSFGFRNRSGGTLLTLTHAGSNQKQTRITNPFGSFLFNNLVFGEVYFLEIKPKRAQQRSGLLVFAFDNLPVFPQRNSIIEKEGIKIIFEDETDN